MSKLLEQLRDFWHWEDTHRIWHDSCIGSKRPRPAAVLNGKHTYIARAVLAEKLGRPIAKGMFACHIVKCNNGMCVEPDHLYEGTASQNMMDTPKEIRVRRSSKAGFATGRKHGTRSGD